MAENTRAAFKNKYFDASLTQDQGCVQSYRAAANNSNSARALNLRHCERWYALEWSLFSLLWFPFLFSGVYTFQFIFVACHYWQATIRNLWIVFCTLVKGFIPSCSEKVKKWTQTDFASFYSFPAFVETSAVRIQIWPSEILFPHRETLSYCTRQRCEKDVPWMTGVRYLARKYMIGVINSFWLLPRMIRCP